MERCVTRKTIYSSRDLAEEALLEAWVRNNYRQGSGPVAVYQCEDCKRYHFTSQGTMNPALKKALDNGSIQRRRDSNQWERKFRG